jgi:hypothetical protein
MIERCRRQLQFADGLIAEEVSDLWEDWMRRVDQVLAEARAATRVPCIPPFTELLQIHRNPAARLKFGAYSCRQHHALNERPKEQRRTLAYPCCAIKLATSISFSARATRIRPSLSLDRSSKTQLLKSS